MLDKQFANCSKSYTLGTPIATIQAIHSDPVTTCAKSDDVRGLHPVIFLAEGSCVMLTANIWQQAGLCNGSAGKYITRATNLLHSL